MKTFSMTKQYITVYVLRDGVLPLFIAIALPWIAFTWDDPRRPDLRLSLLYASVTVVIWFLTLRVPYRLTIRDDHSVEFKGVLQFVVIASRDIRSIEALAMRPGMAELKHDNGKVRLGLQIDGFYEFLWTLKQLNPNIEIRGC